MARRTPPRDSKGRFVKRTRRNLDAFTDSQGRVHPIRGSKGYEGGRTGERATSEIRAGDYIFDRDMPAMPAGRVVREQTFSRRKWPGYLIEHASGKLDWIGKADAVRSRRHGRKGS